MSGIFRRLYPSTIILWACYMALAQPGLPACWLEARACQNHTHFSESHGQSDHSHDFLLDLAKTQASHGLPGLSVPVSLLLAVLFSTRILRAASVPLLFEFSWKVLLDPPPPRICLPA